MSRGPTRRSRLSAVAVLLAAMTAALLPVVGAGAQSGDPEPYNRGYDRSCGSSAQAYSPFDDVGPGTHNQAIGCVAFLDIARGHEAADGRRLYRPRRSVGRDQMGSFIARSLERLPDDVYTLPAPGQPFEDMGGTHADNVHRLRAADIVNGREENRYAPRMPVTRAQMASFIARAIETVSGEELPRSGGHFDDIDGIVHEENIEKLTAIGVVRGRAEGIYHPGSSISRQEMATMLARALDYLAALGLFDRSQVPAPPANEVVAEFTTPLTPGQNRNHNIHRAAQELDGMGISPGERFSLNDALGPRTRERGYRTNGFISDGEVIRAVGGGVSQVATTFFNASWYAGLRILDHQPHSQYFERYPAGRESTLNWRSIDVVVENQSPHPMKLRTDYSSSHVRIRVLSRPSVWVDDWLRHPRGIQSGDSFTARYGRTVTYPDGSTSEDAFTHTYQSSH